MDATTIIKKIKHFTGQLMSKKLVYFLSLSSLLISCQWKHEEHSVHLDSKNDKPPASVHWGYEGVESPEHWAELSPEFLKCAEGHFQSPIDIERYNAVKRPGTILEFNYQPCPIDVVNNGHTIQANPEAENLLVANDHTYHLKQFHFHEPSEHRLDGIIYPMEMHLVHADSFGKLAVIAVFIKEGPESTPLQKIWEALPEHPQEHVHPKDRCDIPHLLPEEKTVYHYSGSLTTPPCTEGVEWFVIEQPISISKSQINKFRKLYHGNSRPIQEQETKLLDMSDS